MYLIKTPTLIQNLFPNFTWKIPSDQKTIYLTFDDGPVKEVTPWVIEQLDLFDAKATFFCVGENVQANSDILLSLTDQGHTLGSHTNNHLSGWSTDNIPYFHNVRRGATLVKSSLFRPPYGRLKPSQVPFLMRHYNIIMWDVLSGDFDPDISADQCLRNVIDHAGPGSIVVFHDSLKSEKKLKHVLPRVLEHFSNQGFQFEKITEKLLSYSPQKQRA